MCSAPSIDSGSMKSLLLRYEWRAVNCVKESTRSAIGLPSPSPSIGTSVFKFVHWCSACIPRTDTHWSRHVTPSLFSVVFLLLVLILVLFFTLLACIVVATRAAHHANSFVQLAAARFALAISRCDEWLARPATVPTVQQLQVLYRTVFLHEFP